MSGNFVSIFEGLIHETFPNPNIIGILVTFSTCKEIWVLET